MEMKKSIVSYADDDDDFETGEHQHATEAKNRSQSKTGRSRNEHKPRETHTSSHITRESAHHRHYHHEQTNRDRHDQTRDHRRSRSRSPRSRHRRPRSRSRESHRQGGRHEHSSRSSRHEECSDSPRHKSSRSCRKSKRDRSKESRNYRHEHRERRSRSASPKRPDLQSSSTDYKDRADTKTEPNIQVQSGNTSATQAALSRAIAMIEAKAPTQQLQTMAPTIPKFYNASAVNPAKIATQEEKRKLLWGDTKKEKSSNSTAKVWTNLQFQGEHGSQMTEKFRKLMGISSRSNDDQEGKPSLQPQPSSSSSSSAASAKGSNISATQETLFQDLERQYTISRMTTHTHRGVGLGFNNNRF